MPVPRVERGPRLDVEGMALIVANDSGARAWTCPRITSMVLQADTEPLQTGRRASSEVVEVPGG